MKIFKRTALPLLVTLLFAVSPALAQGPTILFTDLTSGPNSGGENNNGAIVTIYGKRFGATQGSSTVSVGTGDAAVYKLWSDTKIAVAIGGAVTTGSVVVHTLAGTSACADTVNNCNFTVRSGNIHFVSGAGSDSNNGSFATPWKTLLKARGSMVAGDTVYAMTGSDQKCNDGQGWHAAFTIGSGLGPVGTAADPVAFVVYPGATVQIGTSNAASDCAAGTPQDVGYGIRAKGNGNNYWTFSGFTVTDSGPNGAIEIHDVNWRIVGNDISCPYSNSPDGCLFDGGDDSYVYGNNIHDSGKNVTPSKLFHQMYVQASHVWIGWNYFHDDYDCRHIQVHKDNNAPFGDIHIFGNWLTNDTCDGINLSNIDPSIPGGVEVFNNVIWNVGNNLGATGGNFSGIYIADYNTGTCACPGSGTVEIYNNSFYNVGSFSQFSGDNGAINKNGGNPNITVRLRNNIFQQTSGEKYLCSSGGGYCTSGANLSQITGDTNDWYCTGTCPAIPTQTANNLGNAATDPKFVSTSTPDFNLQPSSPAIDAGLSIATAGQDLDGVTRPQGSAFDLGAYELIPPPQPDPPSNLTTIVQ